MSQLEDMLTRHEALRLQPYVDTEQQLTIGVGRNLSARGIQKDEAALMLQNDLVWVRAELSKYPFWAGLDSVRQDAIADMFFNLGAPRFAGFTKLTEALKRRDYDAAASEMLNSHWASQVKARAVELAAMIRTGEYQAS